MRKSQVVGFDVWSKKVFRIILSRIRFMGNAMKLLNPFLPMKEVEKTCILVAGVSPKIKQIVYLMRGRWVPALEVVENV